MPESVVAALAREGDDVTNKEDGRPPWHQKRSAVPDRASLPCEESAEGASWCSRTKSYGEYRPL